MHVRSVAALALLIRAAAALAARAARSQEPQPGSLVPPQPRASPQQPSRIPIDAKTAADSMLKQVTPEYP